MEALGATQLCGLAMGGTCHRNILQNTVCRTPCNSMQPVWAGVLILFCFSFIFPFFRRWETDTSSPQGKKYASGWPPVTLSLSRQSLPHPELHPQWWRLATWRRHVETIAGETTIPTDTWKSPVVPENHRWIPFPSSSSNKGGWRSGPH